jgi:hypothetical protein
VRHKTLITIGMLAIVALALFVPLSDAAMKVHDAALERSVGAFAVAKGLNAVISLIQGTEFNATPAGVGVTITVGEILDPMNDLVERFSWIMLAASVSLGIQKLLLAVGELTWIKVSLAVLAAAVAGSLWYHPLQRKLPLTAVLRLGVVLLLLRFGAAGFLYTEHFVYNTLMEPQYKHSLAVLSDTKTELDTIAAQSKREAAVKDEGLLDALSGSYDRMKRFFDIDKRLEALKTTLDAAQKEVLNLITLFITLNLLLPLLFLWILLSLFRWALTGRFDRDRITGWFYLKR